MINVSNEFRQCMNADKRKFLPYLNITLFDGTVLDTLNSSDIWEGGFKIDDGVTASGQFTIGSCIVNKLTVTLNNIYDKFSEYDFDGAVITAYLGLELSGGRIEKIQKGVFTVDEPTYNGATITLECLDNMSKLDVDYKDVQTIYPATLETIVRDICDFCGVPLLTTTFDGGDIVIEERPTDDALICRQVLLYAAQRACKFARCDVYGRVELSWFDQSVFEAESLDGGEFDNGTPYYTSGANLDGGTFSDYFSGGTYDGGTFQDMKKYHHIYSLSSMKVSTDDVVITGVAVTEEHEETEEDKKTTYQYGTDGYVISISGNPFISKGCGSEAAAYLGRQLVGMRFRPLSVSCLGDPTVEAGDVVYVTDRKQNTYNCYATNLTFTIGNYMSLSCDAQTPRKNSARKYSELTQAIIAARKNMQKQLSTYDKVVKQMTQLISQGFGMYFTPEVLEDGSTRYYMHDKPTKEESSYICYLTSNGILASVDGGTTWAIDKNGNALYNVLTAIGINAEWINAGQLVVRDKFGNETMFVDTDTGTVRMVVESFTLRGKTVEELSREANEELINAVAEDLQAQLDGKIETYNQANDPSTVWTTTAIKQDHIGDLWYDTNNKVTKRWNGTSWTTQDSQDAAARELAQSKNRIFITTPVPPYDVGDLWVGNSSSDIKRCQTARSSGNYVSSDWILASKYTDDTMANNAYLLAEDAMNAAITPAEYLTQEQVFNVLTENGTLQGIYMRDGRLYINCSYLQGGILKLGGINNQNGVLQVLDSNGNVQCQIDRVSVNINQGNIVLNMDGTLIAKKATIEGSITATSGTIGGFNITDKYIRSQSGNHNMYIASYGYNGKTVMKVQYDSKDQFVIDYDGTVTMAKANITGGKVAIDGSGFGRLSITNTGIALSQNGIVIEGTDGSAAEYALRIRAAKNSGGIIQVYPNNGTSGSVTISGSSISVGGTKSRVVETPNYGERLQYCYEMPSPMFGDAGEGETDDAGVCYIQIDDIFAETVTADIEYQVFLQKEGPGDLWVAEKTPTYFVVKGTENLKFAWEIKAAQRDYEYERLDETETEDEQELDYETDYIKEMDELIREQEALYYAKVE